MSSQLDLTMFVGKAWSRHFTIYDLERQALNLDNAEGIAFTIKADAGDPDESIVAQATLDDGITVETVGGVKKAKVLLTAEKMDVTSGAYVYDLQVKMVNEEAEVACYGIVTVKDPVRIGEP